MISASGYQVRYNEHDQTIVFSGTMRPQRNEDLADTRDFLLSVADKVSGSLYLDLKRLSQINNIAFKELVTFLHWVSRHRADLHVKLVTSSVITWANTKFDLLANLSPKFTLQQYDKDFYPGQGAIENEKFIPVLRAQTRITWSQEQHLLPRHGLTPGARVADICCGIGDFAALVHKTFKPAEVVAVDHSKPSLQYARQVAKEFGLSDVQYLYGDAASLMLEDNRFDFVTCRLSLQIFDRPELILRELLRICRPGGRVYLTNETYSKCFGEPNAESISWTYQMASRLYGDLGMNLEFGTKMNRVLMDLDFEDIRIEPMILTNLSVDRHDFAEVIRSWETYAVEELAKNAGKDETFCTRLRQGFQDHLRAITHPKGFGGWPIWVASGRKPS